ncbi:MAG: sulfatase-like hydrolase/transferase [Planctomycetaceae bacterium]
MQRLKAFAILAAAALGAPMPLHAADAPRTNVVIIYADDLGYGDLACYGHPKFKTPHLDRMAQEGAKLTSFHSTCPYCAPARASLMTGRYPFRNGMAAGNINPQTPDRGLPPEEVTLGEAFQQAGYRTSCIGKWHLGHQPKFHPTRNGFDEYLGILYSNDMRPVELFESEGKIEYPVIQETLTERYTQRAERFIERNHEPRGCPSVGIRSATRDDSRSSSGPPQEHRGIRAVRVDDSQ